MKNLLLFLAFSVGFLPVLKAQEYANFEITATNQGTGTFTNSALSNFTWVATGTINGETQILNDETFDDGNAFENTFGQADNAENLRIQVYPNGAGTAGEPILSTATLTLDFENITPPDLWGFCVVDIDVENCLISAIDGNDNEVPTEVIDDWLVELFDADLMAYGQNIPKWDASHAALLGADTPEDYVIYNNLVIGGLDDSEAAAAFFMPDIPLKSLTIEYENLQDIYFTSYHFYIASLVAIGVSEKNQTDFLIYPNPVTDKFKACLPARQVKSQKLKVENASLEIFDLNGRKLLEKLFPSKSETIEVDVSDFESGIYFCNLITEKACATKKLIIQH